jgi:hypothetical protein
MRPALDPAGHRDHRTKPTCLLHTWRPHWQRPFALVLHLHQHESSRILHLQYLAKNQSTQRCQPLITQGSDHPPVLEPHMVLNCPHTRLGPGHLHTRLKYTIGRVVLVLVSPLLRHSLLLLPLEAKILMAISPTIATMEPHKLRLRLGLGLLTWFLSARLLI